MIINKEAIQFLEFISANSVTNKCGGCFLIFPTGIDRKSWIESELAKASSIESFRFSVLSEGVETEENPEDGIPVYYANCIAFTASYAQSVAVGDSPPTSGAP